MRDGREDTDTQKEMEAEMSDVATSQGRPAAPQSWRRQERLSPQPPQEAWPCQLLDSGTSGLQDCETDFCCSQPQSSEDFVIATPGNYTIRHGIKTVNDSVPVSLPALVCQAGPQREYGR